MRTTGLEAEGQEHLRRYQEVDRGQKKVLKTLLTMQNPSCGKWRPFLGFYPASAGLTDRYLSALAVLCMPTTSRCRGTLLHLEGLARVSDSAQTSSCSGLCTKERIQWKQNILRILGYLQVSRSVSLAKGTHYLDL